MQLDLFEEASAFKDLETSLKQSWGQIKSLQCSSSEEFKAISEYYLRLNKESEELSHRLAKLESVLS